MSGIELRWLQRTVQSQSPASSVDLDAVLQYRVREMRPDPMGIPDTFVKEWSEWMDVPLHREFVELEMRK